jgi:NADH-quinone oxidoreductase subunit C
MLELIERISAHHPRLYPLFSHEFGDAVVGVEPAELTATARDLRDAGFDRLMMVTAVDRGEAFVLVYRLQSRALTAAIFLKTQVPRDEPHVDSLCGCWPAANWQEREVFDLFGITFDGHPDLRRILMPYEYEGYPLRRDFKKPGMISRPDYI